MPNSVCYAIVTRTLCFCRYPVCQVCHLWQQYLYDVCVWRHGYPETHSQTDIWFLKHHITAFWIHQRLSARIVVLNKLRYKRNQTVAHKKMWPMIFCAVIESSSDVFHINQLFFRYMSLTGYVTISHLTAFVEDKTVDGWGIHFAVVCLQIALDV